MSTVEQEGMKGGGGSGGKGGGWKRGVRFEMPSDEDLLQQVRTDDVQKICELFEDGFGSGITYVTTGHLTPHA
eukprot:2769163-Rhodomonas_salina.3